MDMPKNYIVSKLVTTFTCPICELELEDKQMLVDHMKYQHEKEAKGLDMKKLAELEAFKNGQMDVLNL